MRREFISIHALLAESDLIFKISFRFRLIFLSTLSLRRATAPNRRPCPRSKISIHALLAESDGFFRSLEDHRKPFLSTLSLRRATRAIINCNSNFTHFYPRSPCGERPTWARGSRATYIISIHALLAESDCDVIAVMTEAQSISIHALLAESDF